MGFDPSVDESDNNLNFTVSALPAGRVARETPGELVARYLAESAVVVIVTATSPSAGIAATPDDAGDAGQWRAVDASIVSGRGADTGVIAIRFQPNSELRDLVAPTGGTLVIGGQLDPDGVLRARHIFPYIDEEIQYGRPPLPIPMTAAAIVASTEDVP